ncbi:BTAD domain-containing putative transcriptional regulator [Micromonospora sp. NPDC047548]|uniref:AfsR/SARP family transcriptional regulator n=1 Tax=Micromonospora sp. NPDC047548 TaxID=3155624 RepID=UPI00340AB373
MLGPVRGWRDNVDIELGPPQQRTVLATLVAAAGRPVASSALEDVLWAGAPPSAAAATVQQYISRLRRLLEPEHPPRNPAGLIRRVSGGYALATDDTDADLLRWRELVAQARRPAEPADEEAADNAYAEAFALWSGPAASDLPPEVRGHPVFAALDREHVTVLSEAADLALGTGRVEVLVEALDRASTWYPLDEGLHARLLRALAAAGRRAEALRRFRRFRDLLVRELGIEPGPQMRLAHQALLIEPEVQPLPTPAASTAAVVPRPAQLPADLRSFSGRDAELARLESLAEDAMPLVVVAGLGGVGKTCLAVRWAHGALDLYPDGQLYLDLRGFSSRNSPLEPAEALRHFLEALGVQRSHQPSTLEDLAVLYRTALTGKRVLVVLDNARDEDQVRPLLPTALGCTVVVTSRSYLGGLAVEDGARLIKLGVFSETDAHRYLRSRLGKDRLDAEPEAAAEIIEVCGGLPLALAICAAWVERSPAFTLSAVAAEIRRRAGLDAFTGVTSGRDVRAVFASSYRQLSPGAAELFRRLGRHPGTDVALSTAVSVAGRSRAETLDLLAELCNAQLLNEHRPGRYGAHDLVRAYAAELGDAAERQETARRTVEHYAYSLIAAAKMVAPYRVTADAGQPGPVVTPWLPADKKDALAWFAEEHENVRAVLDLAEQEGFDECVMLFGWGLNGFQTNPYDPGNGLVGWDEAISASSRSLAAAQRLGATWWRGYLHTGLGRGYAKLGEHNEAYQHFKMAAEVGRMSGNPLRTASGLLGMAGALVDRHAWPTGEDIELAAELAGEVRTLSEEMARAAEPGSRDPEATRVHEFLGACREFSALLLFHRTGDVAAAVAELGRGIDTYRDYDSLGGEQHLLIVTARLYEQAGDGAHAVEAYERALAVTPELAYDSADGVVSLAVCQARFGDHEAAARTAARARQLLDGVYDAFAERQRARLDALALDLDRPPAD